MLDKNWEDKELKFLNSASTIWWFRGKYRFLARTDKGCAFPPSLRVSSIPHDGIPADTVFPTLENYVQTMRCAVISRKSAARQHSHAHIRTYLNTGSYEEHEDWEAFREPLMWQVLCDKFRKPSEAGAVAQQPDYRLLLMDTSPAVTAIHEANTGCENFWGVCVCPSCVKRSESSGEWSFKGQNVYGKMLLAIRAALLEGKL